MYDLLDGWCGLSTNIFSNNAGSTLFGTHFFLHVLICGVVQIRGNIVLCLGCAGALVSRYQKMVMLSIHSSMATLAAIQI